MKRIIPCTVPEELPTPDEAIAHKSITENMDVLTTVCENESLKRQLAEMEQELNALRKKEAELEAIIKMQSQRLNAIPLPSTEIVQNSHVTGAFKYYTGFERTTFEDLFNFLVPTEEPPLSYSRLSSAIGEMPLKEQVFMTFVRLRLNLGLKNIAHSEYQRMMPVHYLLIGLIICISHLGNYHCGQIVAQF